MSFEFVRGDCLYCDLREAAFVGEDCGFCSFGCCVSYGVVYVLGGFRFGPARRFGVEPEFV